MACRCCDPLEAAGHTQNLNRLAAEVGASSDLLTRHRLQRGRRKWKPGFQVPRERLTRSAAAFRLLQPSRPLADRVLMESPPLLRQQIINSLMAQQPENIADAAMNQWEKLAAEIISIVGEAGFNSLYERSVHLAQSTFPWLPACSSPPQTSYLFAEFRMRLAEQTPAQAREANSLLLTTFHRHPGFVDWRGN